MIRRFHLQQAPLDPAAMLRELENPMAGTVVCFEGRVRAMHKGRAVDHLAYEAFPAMAEREGDLIAAEAISMHGVIDVRIIHLTGAAAIGDPAVWVGVTSEHRKEAFLAAMWIMDTIKQRLPVWKKETFADGGSEWVRPEPPH